MKSTTRLLLVFCLILGLTGVAVFAQDTQPTATPEPATEATEAVAESTEAADSTTNMDSSPTSIVEIVDAEFEGARAFLRFIHLVPDGEAVDVYLDGELTDSQGLVYAASGNWLVVPAGTHTVAVTATGGTPDSAIWSGEVTLAENEPVIVAIVGNAADEAPSVLVVRDNYGEVLPSVGTINFLNALSDDTEINFLRDDVVFAAALTGAGEGVVELNNSIPVDAGTFMFSPTHSEDDTPFAIEPFELPVRDEDNYLIVLAGTADNPQLLVYETPRSQVRVMRGEIEAPGTVLDALNAMGYERFVTMLQDAGIAETLTGEGPYTLFVPADHLLDELAGREDWQILLQNYVVQGDYRSSDVLLAEEGGSLTPLSGTAFPIHVDGDVLMYGDAQIIDVNIMATNGVIHIINDLLAPDEATEGTSNEASG
jgi:uncharacterized surface protein with fasciclin (FAS1) repeats